METRFHPVDRENEHVKMLTVARSRLVSQRHHVVGEIAEDSRRGFNDNLCDALILIQSAIEAVDRAIADEALIAAASDKLRITSPA